MTTDTQALIRAAQAQQQAVRYAFLLAQANARMAQQIRRS